MGLFDDQINLRKQRDLEAFEDSCLRIAGSVMGKKLTAALHDEREQATDAVGEILRFYHVKPREVPEQLTDMEEVLEYLLRPSGFMTREVRLEKNWRRDAAGAMLTTFAENERPVALIPAGNTGYKYVDPSTGLERRVTKRTEGLFSAYAIAFYKPFPARKLTLKDLRRYIFQNLDKRALSAYLLFALIATAVCGIIPFLSRNLFTDVTGTGSMQALAAVAVFLVCASVSGILFKTVQSLFLLRISRKLGQTIEAATMMRILTLPGDFFKNYASGDLASRVMNMQTFVKQLVEVGFATLVTALFSLLYIVQIFAFAPALVLPALTATLVSFAVIFAAVVIRSGIYCRQMELSAQESGLAYALIAGVEKIRLSGAEKRAFARWGKSYATQAKDLYDPVLFVKVSTVIITAVSLAGTLLIYYSAIRTGVSVGQYYAFHTAYAMVVAAVTALAEIAEPAAKICPILSLIRPILETEPEVAEDKPVIGQLSGNIELSNVTFRYREDMPPVLDDISLQIRAGQYVAITGRTGCGKSTLMRVLLGFEKAQRGAVYYDGRDLNRVDLKSLRQRIGTVMQNGALFTGDLYSNIVISDPSLTLEDAWEAAAMAGLAEDIEAMPMGMFTLVPEGGGGLSGGQKQRLMIARAIAPKPKILMFDEATSALDNLTQKQVSDALDSLHCTRIVIAHRLSTIKNCDRILVLDGGKIVEDGTYEALMAQNGVFAELVKRQLAEPVRVEKPV